MYGLQTGFSPPNQIYSQTEFGAPETAATVGSGSWVGPSFFHNQPRDRSIQIVRVETSALSSGWLLQDRFRSLTGSGNLKGKKEEKYRVREHASTLSFMLELVTARCSRHFHYQEDLYQQDLSTNSPSLFSYHFIGRAILTYFVLP